MRLRPPKQDDAEAVAALLIARDIEDLGRPDYTLGALLDDWDLAEVDIERDVVLATLPDGEIAGYAIVRRQGTFAAVSPRREGEGIGTALLDWCEHRQRELGWSEHRTAFGALNTRAAALLQARGYRLIRRNWTMALALEELTSDSFAGRDLTLREPDADTDAAALHGLDAAAFAAVPGTEPESLEAFTDEHLRAHDFDPSLSRVAEQAGQIAGFALTRRWQEESSAFVDILAVAPEHQGKGIGRELLRSVFAGARATGLTEAQLRVSADNPKALRLYEGLGMRRVFELHICARPNR